MSNTMFMRHKRNKTALHIWTVSHGPYIRSAVKFKWQRSTSLLEHMRLLAVYNILLYYLYLGYCFIYKYHRKHIVIFYYGSVVLYAGFNCGYHDLKVCYYGWPVVNFDKIFRLLKFYHIKMRWLQFLKTLLFLLMNTMNICILAQATTTVNSCQMCISER